MDKRRWCTGWVVAVVVFCFLFAGGMAVAQSDSAQPNNAQPDNSQIRAARLSFLQGTVNVDHIDNTGSDPAQINMPLPQGVRVSTGLDGQAEIEFEDGSVVRLTPNSSLELTTLTSDVNGNLTTNLTLDNGLVYAELRAADNLTYSIAAGAVQVSPVVDATVRISMDKPPAVVSVLNGTAQVVGGSASGEGYKTNVNAGETLTADANDPGRYQLTQQVAANSWDKWNDDRDAAAAAETNDQTDVRDGYAGEAGYGWSDLDANGSWYNVPGQGEVWQPNVAMDPGFDPYGYGSWVWYPGSGYVWASGYSWGWTPYRCGNWSYWDDFGWGWQPGIGCGGFGGWGFGGGGYVVNIARPPLRYRFQPKPVHDPGRARPIRVGRPIENPTHVRPVSGIRIIAGRTAEPIRPSPGASSAFKGTARPIGASLRRDFPVNAPGRRSDNNAMPGRGNPNPSVRMRPEGERPVGRQPGNPVNPGTGMEQRDRATSREMRQQPSTEQRQSRPQQQMRPAEQRSMPRYAPPPQQRQSQPHYAPPPQQPHYAPPPQPHYAPPPSAPRSAPSAPAASHK
jgi:Cell division protein